MRKSRCNHFYPAASEKKVYITANARWPIPLITTLWVACLSFAYISRTPISALYNCTGPKAACTPAHAHEILAKESRGPSISSAHLVPGHQGAHTAQDLPCLTGQHFRRGFCCNWNGTAFAIIDLLTANCFSYLRTKSCTNWECDRESRGKRPKKRTKIYYRKIGESGHTSVTCYHIWITKLPFGSLCDSE